jgi:ribonuclease VapC
MVLDTSAIVAAIAAEANAVRFRGAMLEAPTLAISAVTVLECRLVLQSRYGPAAVAEFDDMLAGAAIVIEPFDAQMARAAFDAFRRYGKGQGHPAQLNILDCAAYALAKIRGEPLLSKGADFERTDIQPAV